MKTIYNYAFRIVCVYIFALTVFAMTSIEITNNKSEYKIANANGAKELESSVIMKLVDHTEEKQEEIENPSEEIENTSDEEVVEITSEEESNQEEEQVVVEQPVQNNTYTYVQTIDTSAYPVLQTTTGSLSHYGHDCYGCTSGRTASGYDISNGNIYYTDSTFGSVRIVAAGYEYPMGSILRLTNVESTPIIAIVLDRGNAIGAGKSFTLDLLTESNAKAYQLGTRYGVQIEMLRSGY